MAVTFIVGPGIGQAMSEDNTNPATDEIYVYGERQDAQWSEAMGENGTLYRWVKAVNQVFRFPPDS